MAVDAPPGVSEVRDAINQMHGNPNAASKKAASLWLEEVQRSIDAWQIADFMLTSETSTEGIYYAAQTLRSKIQFDFRELPTGAHDSLCASLLNHLQRLIEVQAASSIRTQLCLAIADLAMYHDGWTNPVADLFSRFGNTTSSLPLLLDLLNYLAEEVSNRRLRVSKLRRRNFESMLSTCVPTVLQFLWHCVEQRQRNGVSISMKRVIVCLSSWLSEVDMRDYVDVLQSACILQFTIEGLQSDDLFDDAIEAICALSYATADTTLHGGTARALLASIMDSMVAKYTFAVQQDDEDMAMGLCRLFSEIGENYMNLVLEGQAMPLVSVLLDCVKHPDIQVAEGTFYFWDNFAQSILLNRGENRTLFAQYFENLIRVLAERLCLSDGEAARYLNPISATAHTLTGDGNNDDDDDDYQDGRRSDEALARRNILDLINDVKGVIGAAKTVHLLAEQSMTLLQRGEREWRRAEAFLTALSSVSHVIPRDDERWIPGLLALQPANPLIQCSIIRVCDGAGAWLEMAPSAMQGQVMRLLLTAVQSSRRDPSTLRQHIAFSSSLSEAACTAFISVASRCRDALSSSEWRDHLLTTCSLVDSLALAPVDIRSLMRAGAILSVCHDDAIRQLCLPVVQELHSGAASAERTSELLDRLATIFRYTQPSRDEPEVIAGTVQVVLEVWPVLERIFSVMGSERRVMERCCSALRYAVGLAGLSAAPIVASIAQTLVSCFSTLPLSAHLYAACVLVDTFACDAGTYSDGLLNMMAMFCEPTFGLLRQCESVAASALAFAEHPDIVLDFFRLCERFALRLPRAFTTSRIMMPCIECAIACLSIAHREANESVCFFFIALIRAVRYDNSSRLSDADVELLRSVIVVCGPSLTRAVVMGIVSGVTPSDTHRHLATVLYKLMSSKVNGFLEWLTVALEQCADTAAATAADQASRAAAIQKISKSESSADALIVLQDYSDSLKFVKRHGG